MRLLLLLMTILLLLLMTIDSLLIECNLFITILYNQLKIIIHQLECFKLLFQSANN